MYHAHVKILFLQYPSTYAGQPVNFANPQKIPHLCYLTILNHILNEYIYNRYSHLFFMIKGTKTMKLHAYNCRFKQLLVTGGKIHWLSSGAMLF